MKRVHVDLFIHYFKNFCDKTMHENTVNAFERIKENSKIAIDIISELKNELQVLHQHYKAIAIQSLQEENLKLANAVEQAKKKLILLEIQNGVKQVSILTQKTKSVTDKSQEATPENLPVTTEKGKKLNKDQLLSETKSSNEKGKKSMKEEPPSDANIDVGRLDFRIGKIEDIQKHPNADSLYVSKINCGDEKPRTICSGLVKHVPMEELRGKNVVVLCNLKPVKMRGISSEGMVMCASTESKVEVLIPPEGSLAGDLIQIAGYARKPDTVLNPKKKIFETVAVDLHTNDTLQACYKEALFEVESKGYCTVKELKNTPIK